MKGFGPSLWRSTYWPVAVISFQHSEDAPEGNASQQKENVSRREWSLHAGAPECQNPWVT